MIESQVSKEADFEDVFFSKVTSSVPLSEYEPPDMDSLNCDESEAQDEVDDLIENESKILPRKETLSMPESSKMSSLQLIDHSSSSLNQLIRIRSQINFSLSTTSAPTD